LLLLSDTHCHIDLMQYDHDRQAVLERAWRSGVQRILIPALDLDSALKVLSLSDSDNRIFSAVGIHPNSADRWNASTRDGLLELCKHPRVRAIGEIGLDYYRDHTTPETQRNVLIEQLTLAADVDKPVILHCRNAFNDLMSILLEWQKHLPPSAVQIRRYPGVFHSFSGDLQQSKAAIEAGFLLGVNGSITFNNAIQMRQLFKETSLQHMLLETDAPFITPTPHRGKRNEPSYVQFINEDLSGLIGFAPAQCAKITYNNACKIFNW
jgi:TatD DNase family protein